MACFQLAQLSKPTMAYLLSGFGGIVRTNCTADTCQRHNQGATCLPNKFGYRHKQRVGLVRWRLGKACALSGTLSCWIANLHAKGRFAEMSAGTNGGHAARAERKASLRRRGERGPEEQPLETCGRFRPAVRYPVGRHATEQVGPMIAWTSSGPSSMRLSAVVPRIELQPKNRLLANGVCRRAALTYSHRRAT
jgi:hypothetical protein